MNHLFDAKFNGMPHSGSYHALLVPDLYPYEKPMLVDQWPAQDRAMYCGGEHTPGYYSGYPAGYPELGE